MTPVELGCLAVIAVFVVAWRERLRERRFLEELGLVAAAAWAAEDSCIRLYGFYAYESGPWSIYVDRVPLLVAIIWPLVILSARDLVRARTGLDDVRLISRVATIVLFDAAFIEPAAVYAGLWKWTAPGPFGVPLIGILGWSFFAWVASLALASRARWLVVLVSPLVTHLLLLVTWWGALRWIPPLPDGVAGALAFGLGLAISSRIQAKPMPNAILLPRIAAAAFFAALLFTREPPPALLLLWCAGFVIPWSVLTWRAVRSQRAG